LYASAKLSIGITGFDAGAQSSSSKTSRMVDPKLSAAFIPLIEQMIMETGGIELYTRSDLDKVDAELKLQDSGLLDPNSVVEFGKTSGVKYIVTGSIDYVEHSFKDYSSNTEQLSKATANSDNDNIKLLATGLNFVAGMFDGTTIKTALTVKILDVATGKVVFSKQIKNDTLLNSKKKPTYGQLVEAIKTNISEAIPTLQKQFASQFGTNGYISKIRKNGDDYIAQINMGTKDNIKKGDKFIVYSIETSIDPLTNKSSCDTIATDIELEATEHISQTQTWTKVIDGDGKNIRLLQLVRRK